MKIFETKLPLLLAGSLLFQTVQLGTFPILIAQLLSGQGVDTGTIGLVLAVSWIAILVFGPFVPRLIEKLGAKGANTLGAACSLMALAIILVLQTMPALVASAILMGSGLIIRWVLCDTLVVAFSPPEKRGRMIGLHEALMGLGIACGPLFFSVLSVGQTVLASVAVCLLGAGFFVVMHSSGTGRNGEPAIEPSGYETRALKLLASGPIVFLALAAACLGGFIESAAIALFPLGFEAAGWSLPVAAVLVSAFGFGGTILQPPLGWAADRYGYTAVQGGCVAVMLATCVVAATGPAIFWLIMANVFLMGAAAGGFNTLAVIQAGQVLPVDKVPLAMTAIAMLYTIGGIAGPVASGAAMEYLPATGTAWVFFAAGGVFGIGLVFWVVAGRGKGERA